MRFSRALVLRSTLAAFPILAAASTAQAQFPGSIPDTFRLNAGGMYAWFNTDVTFEQNSGAGNAISFEDLLDVPKSHAGFYGHGELNFGFLGFDFGYVGFSRSRGTTISQDIV